MAPLIQVSLALFGVLCLFVIIALPFYLVIGGGIEKFGLMPLRRCYEGRDVHEGPQLDDVSCVYHTYRGLLLWSTQDEHQIHASFDDARELLRRLLRYNLTWGLLTHGVVFVPVLAIVNYRRQLKLIEQQQAGRC